MIYSSRTHTTRLQEPPATFLLHYGFVPAHSLGSGWDAGACVALLQGGLSEAVAWHQQHLGHNKCGGAGLAAGLEGGQGETGPGCLDTLQARVSAPVRSSGGGGGSSGSSDGGGSARAAFSDPMVTAVSADGCVASELSAALAALLNTAGSFAGGTTGSTAGTTPADVLRGGRRPAAGQASTSEPGVGDWSRARSLSPSTGTSLPGQPQIGAAVAGMCLGWLSRRHRLLLDLQLLSDDAHARAQSSSWRLDHGGDSGTSTAPAKPTADPGSDNRWAQLYHYYHAAISRRMQLMGRNDSSTSGDVQGSPAHTAACLGRLSGVEDSLPGAKNAMHADSGAKDACGGGKDRAVLPLSHRLVLEYRVGRKAVVWDFLLAQPTDVLLAAGRLLGL